MEARSGLRTIFPPATAAIVGIATVVYLIPWLGNALVYDRAAILHGEVWRLATGNWVHFSAEHFLYDTLAFAAAGWVIESRRLPGFAWLCLVSPICIGAAEFLFEPQLEFCGGLSGITMAAVVFLALHGASERGAWRWMCLFALALTFGKILFELRAHQFIFLKSQEPGLVVAASSHVAGALLAIGIYFVMNARCFLPILYGSRTLPKTRPDKPS